MRNYGDLQKLARQVFDEYDFWEFDDSQMPTVPELASHFSTADLIIAPHGAGLSNLLFAKANATVVELLTLDWPVMVFAELSAQLGLKYHGTMPAISSHTDGFHVDIEETEAIFNRIKFE